MLGFCRNLRSNPSARWATAERLRGLASTAAPFDTITKWARIHRRANSLWISAYQCIDAEFVCVGTAFRPDTTIEHLRVEARNARESDALDEGLPEIVQREPSLDVVRWYTMYTCSGRYP
jgi:hypothetical protein